MSDFNPHSCCMPKAMHSILLEHTYNSNYNTCQATKQLDNRKTQCKFPTSQSFRKYAVNKS